jgi:putative ABC transport system permease protein
MSDLLSAIRHQKVGALLIALQVAITLAIVCNALSIIIGRIDHLHRPSGLREQDLLSLISAMPADDPSGSSEEGYTRDAATIDTDLASIRQIPGVEQATATYSLPFSNNNVGTYVTHGPDLPFRTSVSLYFADPQALATLGLKLNAGRNFREAEIQSGGLVKAATTAGPVMITRALADTLFPPPDTALGKPVFVYTNSAPSTIVGIVDLMHGPYAGADETPASWNIVLLPAHVVGLNRTVNYVARSKPGYLDDLRKKVPAALYANQPLRVIDPAQIQSMEQIRAEAYRADRGMVILMTTISVVLLAVTGAGIFGLCSFWVGQRRRQIGMRRALGAKKRDILAYFLAENALMTGAGVVVGIILTIAVNGWLMETFVLTRLAITYIVIGPIALLALGQAAALAPALRASQVSPVEAMRTT